jgi:hypothetical protein
MFAPSQSRVLPHFRTNPRHRQIELDLEIGYVRRFADQTPPTMSKEPALSGISLGD